MKKILALLMAVLMSLSVFSLIACNLPTDSEGESKCAECVSFGAENSYKIDGMTMKIGNACLECGYIPYPIEEIELTHIATEDEANVITKIQDQNPDVDLVIGLKKGHYQQIFVGSPNRKVHVVCESGTQVVIAQCNGSADGVTFENMYFYTDPIEGGKMSQVKFETAGGSNYWSNIVVKNCVFEGKSKIDSSWKNGVIDNMTIEGCTFKNLTGWGAGAGSACAIFTDENWGETIIRDCVFDHIDYAAIRFGRISTEGHVLVENCFFRDIKGNACIMFVAKNETLQTDESISQVDITLEVKNNVFADSKAFSYSKGLGKKSTANLDGQKLLEAKAFNERLAEYNAKINAQFIVGPNTWVSIPTSVSKSTYYDIREQQVYEGEI